MSWVNPKCSTRKALDAVTMRRVADRLGVAPMTLYTYVPGKAELLELMLDAVYAAMPRADSTGRPWRERLAAVAQENKVLYDAHPWAAAVSTSRATAMTDGQWWAANAPVLERVLDPAAYPRAVRIGSAAGIAQDSAYDPQRAYGWGLARVLDGLGALVEPAVDRCGGSAATAAPTARAGRGTRRRDPTREAGDGGLGRGGVAGARHRSFVVIGRRIRTVRTCSSGSEPYA